MKRISGFCILFLIFSTDLFAQANLIWGNWIQKEMILEKGNQSKGSKVSGYLEYSFLKGDSACIAFDPFNNKHWVKYAVKDTVLHLGGTTLKIDSLTDNVLILSYVNGEKITTKQVCYKQKD